MDKEVKELRNLARHNRNNIMNKSITICINGKEYSFLIKGVGAKAIKLECYFSYEDILKNHDNNAIESKLWNKINTIYKDVHTTSIGNKSIFY